MTGIDGVVIKKIITHTADDGFFAEIVKEGDTIFHDIKQTSYSETPPGVIKAFHLHRGYWEIWCVIKGRARIVLADVRDGSPTRGRTQIIMTGADDMRAIAIPPGVAHGYRALGDTPMGIVYHAGEAYDASKKQIEEIPHDSPEIGFDWTMP
jgi:dTDP-4-dehydrorhamnose 3,5-epimerase